MYIHYSTGNNSGPRTLVPIVEASVIGGVHFRRFHCSLGKNSQQKLPTCTMFTVTVDQGKF